MRERSEVACGMSLASKALSAAVLLASLGLLVYLLIEQAVVCSATIQLPPSPPAAPPRPEQPPPIAPAQPPPPCPLSTCELVDALARNFSALNNQWNSVGDVSLASFYEAALDTKLLVPYSMRTVIYQDMEMRQTRMLDAVAAAYGGGGGGGGFGGATLVRLAVDSAPRWVESQAAWTLRTLDIMCTVSHEAIVGGPDTRMSYAFGVALEQVALLDISANARELMSTVGRPLAMFSSRASMLDAACPPAGGPSCGSAPEAVTQPAVLELLRQLVALNVKLRAWLNATAPQEVLGCRHAACCEGTGLLRSPPPLPPAPPEVPPPPAPPSAPPGYCLCDADGLVPPPPVPLPALPPPSPLPPTTPAPPPPHSPLPGTCAHPGLGGLGCQRCVTDAGCALLMPSEGRCEDGAGAVAWAVSEAHKGLDCRNDAFGARVAAGCIVDDAAGWASSGHATGTCTLEVVIGSGIPVVVECSLSACEMTLGDASISCGNATCADDGRDATISSFVASITGSVAVDCSGAATSNASASGEVLCDVDIGALAVRVDAACVVSRCVSADISPDVTMGSSVERSLTALARARCLDLSTSRFPLLGIGLAGLATALMIGFAGCGHARRRRSSDVMATAPEAEGTDLCEMLQRLAPTGPTPTIEWTALHITAARGVTILQPTSGALAGGTCTALMGPSGSGKTSMLHALAGHTTTGLLAGGTVALDGTATWPKGEVLLVPQDAVLPEVLTPYEILSFACALRLGSAHAPLVEQILSQLGLTRAGGMRIGGRAAGGGGLSGGERKRVCVGVALAVGARVMLLDEPSSGLDAYSAYTLAKTLSLVASRTRRLVLLSVHQPSSQLYDLFDRAILLCGGKVAFAGAPCDAVRALVEGGAPPPELGVSSPDHLLHVLVTHADAVRGAEMPIGAPVAAAAAGEADNAGGGEQRPRGVSMVRQFRWLTWRCAVQLAREPSLLRTQVAVQLFMAAFMGAAFFQVGGTLAGFQNKAGALQYLLTFYAFGGLATAGTLTREWALVWEEHHAGLYSIVPYCASRLLLELAVLRVLPALGCGALFYVLMGLRADFYFLCRFLVASAMASVDAALICCCVAACAPRHPAAATLVSTLILLVSLLLSGIQLNLASAPPLLAALAEFSFARHAYEIMLVGELHGTTVRVDVPGGASVQVQADVILEVLGLREGRIGADMAVLVTIGLVLALAATVAVGIGLGGLRGGGGGGGERKTAAARIAQRGKV